jgi:hypothetical protein
VLSRFVMEHDNRVFFFGCTIVTGRGALSILAYAAGTEAPRAASRTARGRRCKNGPVGLGAALQLMPEVPGVLHVQPKLRRRAEGGRQAQR